MGSRPERAASALAQQARGLWSWAAALGLRGARGPLYFLY